ncbi:MAG: Hsp20/alpha crystallin family protein [archaeon GB-1867-005]|nr:Hsp20/alpha crystallin family protein [Candidatus Culexmicrobium cathedralense]
MAVERFMKVVRLPGLKFVCMPGMCVVKVDSEFRDVELTKSTWSRFHIEEKLDEYIITVELPGVEKKNIQLYVSERSMFVKAKPTVKLPWTPEVFKVKLPLKSDVEVSGVRAKYENGVLTITLPKKVAPKKIEVE